jgi:predicted O-methyltransferase YrrM
MINLSELDDDIVIHKGDILKTLPDVLKNEGLSFSFVYCDTDLYAPIRLILDSLHPRLSKGGIIAMDEWNYDKWPGEAIAVREFMEHHGESYEMCHVNNARQPSLVLKKIR